MVYSKPLSKVKISGGITMKHSILFSICLLATFASAYPAAGGGGASDPVADETFHSPPQRSRTADAFPSPLFLGGSDDSDRGLARGGAGRSSSSVAELSDSEKTIADHTLFDRPVRMLDLSEKGLQSLEGLADIPSIETVTVLNLSRNPLRRLRADSFICVPNLISLDLSDCDLHVLPPTLLMQRR